MVIQGLTGVPMVASSPIRHDGGPMGVGIGGPLDVTAYQAPWKTLSDFALTHDLDRVDPNSPQYQQLIQQVRILYLFYGSEQFIESKTIKK